mmetsp:Transcript_9481/g.26489  ORF Transcript_9481/g.26489 Transcript_9481/m.26489 type:complete len:120 (-) Transcript_9481:425-784(-)
MGKFSVKMSAEPNDCTCDDLFSRVVGVGTGGPAVSELEGPSPRRDVLVTAGSGVARGVAGCPHKGIAETPIGVAALGTLAGTGAGWELGHARELPEDALLCAARPSTGTVAADFLVRRL